MIRQTTYKRKQQLRNIGLLILRIGLGFMFILHGYPKLMGGPETWEEYGTAMQYVGIDVAPIFFGFLAGITEFFGGIFLIMGLFFTPTLIFLILTMLVATAQHIGTGDGFSDYSHSIELGVVFLSLLFIGAGRYSIDYRLSRRRRRLFP